MILRTGNTVFPRDLPPSGKAVRRKYILPDGAEKSSPAVKGVFPEKRRKHGKTGFALDKTGRSDFK